MHKFNTLLCGKDTQSWNRTWEPTKNLKNVADLVCDFHKPYPHKPRQSFHDFHQQYPHKPRQNFGGWPQRDDNVTNINQTPDLPHNNQGSHPKHPNTSCGYDKTIIYLE